MNGPQDPSTVIKLEGTNDQALVPHPIAFVLSPEGQKEIEDGIELGLYELLV